jgi:DNA-binding NarL/FixJ family response regulator
MAVKILLADDAAIIRNGIRALLSNRADIAVIGEASSFRETIQKTAELHPDLIVLDVHLADEDHIALTEVKGLLNGAKVLAISFGSDEHTGELAASVGAVKLLDKMDLSDQLIPAILELGEVQSSQTAA